MNNIQLNVEIRLPHECVPILEDFTVGQRVTIKYNGGMGGVYDVEGVISEIDRPFFAIRKDDGNTFDAVMGDILFITLLKE